MLQPCCRVAFQGILLWVICCKRTHEGLQTWRTCIYLTACPAEKCPVEWWDTLAPVSCRSVPAPREYSPTPSASSSQSPSLPPAARKREPPPVKVMEAPVVARRSAVSAPAAQGAPAHSPLLVSGLPSYLTEDKVRGHKPLVSP